MLIFSFAKVIYWAQLGILGNINYKVYIINQLEFDCIRLLFPNFFKKITERLKQTNLRFLFLTLPPFVSQDIFQFFHFLRILVGNILLFADVGCQMIELCFR